MVKKRDVEAAGGGAKGRIAVVGSLDFTTDTYKLGLEWTPIEDIRTRASFQRAVRVPNVAELYGLA